MPINSLTIRSQLAQHPQVRFGSKEWEGGEPPARREKIVIPPDATPAEKLAIMQLAYMCRQLGGNAPDVTFSPAGGEKQK